MGQISGDGVAERAVVFGRAGHLVGIVSAPAGGVSDAGVGIAFINSGIIHRVGGNRLYVRLARALARRGATVLRFDLSGLGDSGVPPHQAELARVEVEQQDINEALTLLEELGSRRLIVAGLCSGADNSLLSISRNDRVSGALLLDPFAYRTWKYYLTHYGPRMVRPAAWWRAMTGQTSLLRDIGRSVRSTLMSARSGPAPADLSASSAPAREVYEERLRRLIGRDARMLWVFTGGLDERYNYRDQFFDAFPELDLRSAVDFEYIAGADHTFSREVAQRWLEDRVANWYDANFGNAGPDPEPGHQRRSESATVGLSR